MSYPILATKLYIPSTRSNLVPRPRLVERLNQGLDSKLTLISAPAGFGKTTFLCEWIGQSELPVAWLSLDQNDNDLGRFLAYLIASLGSINIAVDEQILNLLGSQQAEKIEALLIPLINQIAAVEGRFVLVLDDYHLIHSQDIHQALTYLLDYQPPNIHLIIASRADPPLALARLRARGQMTEIRTADLRFSIEEGDTLLNQVQGLNLSPQDIHALIDRTDGWVAALQMASIAIQSKQDASLYIQDFSGSRDYIADYLTSEVIDQQPEDIHTFLLKTSILDRLNGPLCDAITGQGNGSLILRQLKEANLFLVPLDDESHWFRYHRLFADLLQQRLLEMQPDILPGLYHQASQWFEEDSALPEAIDYAIRGKDFDRAADLIEKEAEATLKRSEIATFIQWMGEIPDEVICKQGSLCIYYAWALIVDTQDLKSAARYLDQVRASDDHRRSQLDAVKSMLAFYQRQIPQAIDLARQAWERLPQDDIFFRQIAAWNLSALLFISGDTDGGVKMLAEVSRISLTSNNYLVAIIALCRLGSVQTQQGDLHRAKELFEQAIQVGSDDPDRPLPAACEAMLGLGKVHWEWYQLETASQRLLEGIELSKRWREVTAIEGYITMTHLNQTLGDVDHADQMIQEAKKLARQNTATDIDDKFVASQEAHLRLRQGNIQAAENWAQTRGLEEYRHEAELDSKPRDGADIILRYELLVYARLLIAQNQPGDAVRLLKALLPSMEHLGHRAKILETHILTAMGLSAQGDTGRALSALEKAIPLAESGGFVRIFLDEGSTMGALISEASARGIRSEFTAALLAHFSSDQGKSALTGRSAGLVEPLSEREIEVLRTLATEQTGPEIAEHLYISVSTFRTHVKNIYAKLGVHSRFEAVAKGKELQLF